MSKADSADRSNNPYVGPRPFERSDQDFFFGRDTETRELASLVIADRIVLLYAASGAGKTSLLNAGLVPLLEQTEHFQVLPLARVGGAPDERLVSRARNVYAFSVLSAWLPASSEVGLDSLDLSLNAFLALQPHLSYAAGLTTPRALIFDQFEELFTVYPAYWRQRQDFVEQIGQMLDEDPLLRVVLAIREDYLAELDPYVSVLPGSLRTRYRLERLRPDQALRAVTEPALKTSRRYAPGVAEKLISDLLTLRIDVAQTDVLEIEGEFVEPVQLQVTCRSLWSELPNDVNEVREEDVRKFGDVNQILASFYDDAVRRAAAAGRVPEKRVRRWVEQVLITSIGTRGTIYRTKNVTARLPNESIDELEDIHVIRGEWRAGARWYELTHDRLIRPILDSNARVAVASGRARRRRLALAAALVVIAFVIVGVGLAGHSLRSPALVPVPNLAGVADVFSAQKVLVAAGLALSPQTTNVGSQTVPPGTIVAQTPAAGADVARGTMVAIVVAVLPSGQVVPSVVGLTVPAAKRVLRAAGFNLLANVGRSASSSGSTITAQTPAASQILPTGSVVQVLVGPPSIQ